MDERSVTASPERAEDGRALPYKLGEPQPLPDRRLEDISQRELHTPGSTQEANTSLSNLIQVLIDQSHLVDDDVAPRDSPSNGCDCSTSSYDGDEGTPLTGSSGTSNGPIYKPIIGIGSFYDIRSSSSLISSSPEANVRLKTVPHHSVTKSIVRSDSPMPAHYLHSSNPTNINNQSIRNLQEPGLGRMTRPKALTVGKKSLPSLYFRSSASSTSSSGRGNEGPDSRADPNKNQGHVLSRRPPAPALIIDSALLMAYDVPSSALSSQLPIPDLLSKPPIIDRRLQERPPTPTNTLASPRPLISIIPPTPSVISSAINSPGIVQTKQEQRMGDYRSITVLAHTGASTPEESTIYQTIGIDARSRTTEKGTMTDFNYDEDSYAESSDELQTPPRISTPMTPLEHCPNTLLVEQHLKHYLKSEEIPQIKILVDHTQDNLDELASYSDSDTNVPTRGCIVRNLYEEFALSDPRHNHSESKPTLKSQPRRTSILRERKISPADRVVLPMSTSSFTRIINDLEDMLDQALELAGRAVIDSNTALEQRDASIRSAHSLRESILSDGESIFGIAIAEPFRTANDQQSAEKLTDDRKTLPIIGVLRKKLPGDSTLAVYRDDGEAASDAEDEENTKLQRRGRTSNSESDRRPTRKNSAPAKSRIKENNLELSSSKIPRPTRNSTINGVRSSSADHIHTRGRNFRLRTTVSQQDKSIRAHQPPLDRILLNKIPRKKAGWDWSLAKKRYAAGVSCSVVALIGFIVGCYGGEAPAIRTNLGITIYLTLMGDVLFILGIAVPSLLFWPLSLLHGRKPYTLLAIALAIPLQIPQALSLPPHTTPNQGHSMIPFFVCILVFRTASGFVLGFASMNVLATLVDLFGPDTGACCRGGVVFNSSIPIEGQDQFHLVPGGEAGARMGIWLGLWTWLFLGFSGIGFLVGQLIITQSSPAWGFWIIAILGTLLLCLVWFTPEVRPPWRKKRALPRRRTGWKRDEEEQYEDRGEIKMIIFGIPPKWWWEEVWAGTVLSFRMCQQLGFLVVAVYVGWIAGAVATVFNLLVALEFTRYSFNVVDAGLATLGLSVGALLSVPVQLSTFYLPNFRHRVHHRGHLEAQHHYHEGQHPYRTSFLISVFIVPSASLGFTISATGPPIHFIIPAFFAGLVAFSGVLAISECHLIIMENFDISNLPEPLLSSASGSTSHGSCNGGRLHGTQRPSSLVGSSDGFTTCHPAITSAFGILQFMALTLIACSIAWSRCIINGIGIKYGLGIFTGVTFVMSIALISVLWRWKKVRVLELYADQNSQGQLEEPEARVTEEIRICKISILQRGKFTRWSEVNGIVYSRNDEEDAWRVRRLSE